MSSRWLTTRKRKRVRAIDPYLGFYPQSDPPSEAAQERPPQGASTHPVPDRSGDSIQAQETSPRRAQASPSTIMRASSSPGGPRPPKRTYAARKRRCIESDDEYAQSDAAETEDLSYWSSSDVPAKRPARVVTQLVEPKAKKQLKQPKTQPVRGPFATRLIEKSLATGTRLADDLQAVHDSTVPQLKLGAKPRARATQTLATFASRRAQRADAPIYAFPPLKLGRHDENAFGNADELDNNRRRPGRQIRLSQLRQPTTRKKTARKQQQPDELTFKPLTFQHVSGSSRRQPTQLNRKGPVAATAQGILRLAPVKSTRGIGASSSRLKSSMIGSGSARQRHPTFMQATAAPFSRDVDVGQLDDWDTISVPTSDIVTPSPGQFGNANDVSQPRASKCKPSPGSSTTASDLASQHAAAMPQELRSQTSIPHTQIFVRETPEPRDTTRLPVSRGHGSPGSSCYVSASMSMPSSSAPPDATVRLNPGITLHPLYEEEAAQILVLNSSQVLTPETQLSPQYHTHEQAATVTSTQSRIFVPDSSQVLVAETSFASSRHPPILAPEDAAGTKRTRLFKTIAELSDSVLESIAHNAFVARSLTSTC